MRGAEWCAAALFTVAMIAAFASLLDYLMKAKL